jgi:hypothetical protein
MASRAGARETLLKNPAGAERGAHAEEKIL